MTSDPMLSPGRLIAGRYRLKGRLGTGGMGEVWIAEHIELDAPVAIKFQHALLAGGQGANERFQREAKIAARIRSPHVVRVQDYGVDSGVPFIAMELLEGESLRARLDREQRVMPREAARILRQAAAGLDLAHAAGVVHRDIKPSNLFLAREANGETTKLLDFGIAKWSDAAQEPTASALVLGSARYMSPEQARGEKIDRSTDIWSLGVVAYEMLTGEAPFQGANLPDACMKICSGVFARPSEFLGAGYSRFDGVFEQALAVPQNERPASASELAEVFERATTDWTSASPSTLGRSSDTETMRATSAARAATSTKRGGALWLAIATIAMALMTALWYANRVTSSREAAEISRSVSTTHAASTVSVNPIEPAAVVAPEKSTKLAAPPAPEPSVAAPSASVTVRPRAPRSLPRAAAAEQTTAPSKNTKNPEPPEPKRSTDPDFGLAVPAR
jgi:serine/threonine-protein kinase